MKEDTIARELLARRAALSGYYRAVTRDACLADDIFQEVCVRAIQRGAEFADPEHLVRWSHTTGRNLALDHLRKSKNAPLLLSEAVLEKLEHEALERASTGDRHRMRALDACLATLTPRSRKIVALRYGEELSGIDVARRLNRKVDAVYKALARIYSHLRVCVERRMKDEPCP